MSIGDAITPREFARKHFKEYHEKSGEIVTKLCPYCFGGKTKDKYTFAMNGDTGVFNCKRGSCGVSGTFFRLKTDFGEINAVRNYEYRVEATHKAFKPSSVTVDASSGVVLDYLALRKISAETCARYLIGDDGAGNICFQYIKDEKRVAVKYRPARKIEKGERKQWREAGTDTTTLYGMQLVNADTSILYITEGEIDCLSLAEVGVPNAVSVPNGSQDYNWIDANWDWLEKFKVIVICGDNDKPGHEMVKEVSQRLGKHRCYIAKLPDDCKDANEVLYRHGKDKLTDAIANAKEVPIAGLMRLADVEALDLTKMSRVKTGITKLDKATGGLFMGQTTVVTGSNGSGKSTLVGQMLLEIVEQKTAVCAFSGELPKALFRYWIDLQAAGTDGIEYAHDPIFDADKPFVPTVTAQKIRTWYRNSFFLYDNETTISADNVMSIFEYAAQRYNCKVFLVDNLMMLMGGSGSDDYYRRQSDFIMRCTAFAKSFQCHVIIVAHPRKTTGRLTKLDIAGSGDISNLADNVLAVHRLSDAEKAEEAGKSGVIGDEILDVFKSRFSGQQEVHIGLYFEENCKRFYQQDKVLLDRTYGWRIDPDGTYELPSETPLPF